MFLTYERKEMAWRNLEHSLSHAGSNDYELMICDQGTEDRDYITSMEKHFKPSYFRKNFWNEGVARSLNQMMIRRKHKDCLFLPNDFKLQTGWLKRSIEYLDDVPNAGIVGFNWQTDMILPTIKVTGKSGKEWSIECQRDFMFDGSQVMGATFFTENMIDEIGYLDEDFSPYGFEDQNIAFRAKVAGLDSFYMPDVSAEHMGVDEFKKDPDYKDQKERHLHNNVGLFRWKSQNLHKTGVYIPAPMKRPEFSL